MPSRSPHAARSIVAVPHSTRRSDPQSAELLPIELPIELRRMILCIYEDELHVRALLAELRALIEFTCGEPAKLLSRETVVS